MKSEIHRVVCRIAILLGGIYLPCQGAVTLISPPDQAVAPGPNVTFSCTATDAVGLLSATLYLAEAPKTLTFSGPSQAADAHIRADYPNNNYGADPVLNVDGATPHAHGLIKFPALFGAGTDQVPLGAVIVSASLKINVTNTGNALRLYRLTEDWVESEVTWQNRSAGAAWGNPGADGTLSHETTVVTGDCSSTGWRTIDVKALVAEWSNGEANYGLVMVDSGTDGIDFWSSEAANAPVLTVTFRSALQPMETKPLSGLNANATFSPVTLEDSKSYVWNCQVENSNNEMTWAPADFQLTVDANYPAFPALVGPLDGATGVAMPATLQVQVADPNGDALTVSFYGRKKVTGLNDFTIVALPDTQKYTASATYAPILTQQTQWIVNNAAARNIVFVCQEGDIVDVYDNTTMWGRANTSFSLLDGQVAYGLLPGNHDIPTTFFNQYFPASRYEGQPWYGGHYGSDNDNSYQLISAGGEDLIILHLQYWPASEVITWADGVLKAHANRKAILVTHSFLNASGQWWDSSKSTNTTYFWNGLVVPNPNVYFVLCGHEAGEYRRTDVVNGHAVHQLLSDYQSRANGGNGWLRMMRFAPAEDKVYVETYSPYLNQFEIDTNSQFTLDLPMKGFKLLAQSSNVTSGSVVAYVWDSLEYASDYEWYVSVTDPSGRTTQGSIWQFRTASGDTAPPVIDNIAATEITENSVRITWTTDEPSDSQAQYGLDANYGTTASDATMTVNHSLLLTGLTPLTTYHYRVISQDAAGNSSTSGDFTFTTLPHNNPPVANPQEVATAEDAMLGVTLTGSDADGDALSYTVTGAPQHGALTGAAPNLVYTPSLNYNGPDSFAFTVSDGKTVSSPATVNITVNPINDPPLASAQTVGGDEDAPLGITLSGSDVDGDPLVYAVASYPLHGALSGAAPNLVYTPNANYNGPDSFTFTVGDGQDLSSPATVTIIVNPINDAPVAQSQTAVANEDSSANIALTGTDVEGDALSYAIASAPAHGTLSGTAPNLVYTPQPNFNGSDSFSFTVSDGQAVSSPAQVTITVNGINDAPAANAGLDQTVQRDETVTLDGSTSTDPDGDTLSYLWQQTVGPAVTLSDPAAARPTFVAPAVDADTQLEFTLTVSDGALMASDTVSVTVKSAVHEVFVEQDPVVTFGTVGGNGIQGTWAVGDGLIQTFTEAANGGGGKSSLQVQYALHTTATPALITSLTLFFNGNWTQLDATDALKAAIWNGTAWEDITADLLADGAFSPAANAKNYVDTNGNIWIMFTDSVSIRNEKKDILTVDYLSVRITVGPPDTQAPSAPVGVAAAAAGLTVALTWNANSEADLAGYRVYRSATPGSGYELVTAQLVTGATYNDTTPAAGAYYYVITAVDQSGNESIPSQEVNVTTTQPLYAVHVENIAMALEKLNKNSRAIASVLIHHQGEAAQAGATVVGDWYFKGSLVESGATGVTGADGVAVISSALYPAKSGNIFTFKITNALLGGYSYDQSKNVMSENSIAAP